MHPWLVLLHVFGVLSFLLAHGASAAVMFRVRTERDPVRVLALIDLSRSVATAMALTALLLFLSGIAAGFTGHWWGRGWIWTSLGLFLAMSLAMSALGRLYFDRIRLALGVAVGDPKKQAAPPAALPPSELAAVLDSGRPMLLAGIGIGGLAVITWLMLFKPF